MTESVVVARQLSAGNTPAAVVSVRGDDVRGDDVRGDDVRGDDGQ